MMRCGNKSVVRVAQRVAALVLVQGLSSLPSNMYCLFDPSIIFVWFSVQNSGGWPVDHVVIMRCMVSQCWFVLLRQTWCMLVFAPLQLANLLPETSMYQVCLSSSKRLESKTRPWHPVSKPRPLESGLDCCQDLRPWSWDHMTESMHMFWLCPAFLYVG